MEQNQVVEIKEEKKTINKFKGYSLFKDIEDVALRDRNRAVVMSNMCEQNTKDKKINGRGISLVAGYFRLLPKEERSSVLSKFEIFMGERGFAKSSEV